MTRRTLPLLCALVLAFTGQSPVTGSAPPPAQILTRALERLRSYPVPSYVVWTNFWFIARTAPELVTSTTGGWTDKRSTWRRSERFAERTSDGLQNVTWSIPVKSGALPDAHFSSVFEGPLAWTLLPRVTAPAANASPMRPDIAGLKTIATVTAYAKPAYAVDVLGTEAIDGHAAYHLRLRPLADPRQHNLRGLWIDVDTFDIRKAHFAGSYPALVPYGTPPLVPSDITADFKPILTYWIVYRLAWTYDYDGSHFAFDTHIGEIAFPRALPDWLFDAAAYAQHQKAKEPDVLYQVLQTVPQPMPSWY